MTIMIKNITKAREQFPNAVLENQDTGYLERLKSKVRSKAIDLAVKEMDKNDCFKITEKLIDRRELMINTPFYDMVRSYSVFEVTITVFEEV